DFWGATQQQQQTAADPFAPTPASAAAPGQAFDPFNPFGGSAQPAQPAQQQQQPIPSGPFTFDLSAAYAQSSAAGYAPPPQQQQQTNDPFSTDLFNLTNINSTPGAQSSSVFQSGISNPETFRSKIPLNQLPATTATNPFGASAPSAPA